MLPPKKSLGQNFLRDENVARNIVDSLHVQADDVVVEIGPGQGALTKYLQNRCARLIAIEIDERAVSLLRESLGPSVEIVHADIRTVDLAQFAGTAGRLRVVGNIPYNITSEILFWLFDQHTVIGDATLMVQLEVARRFVAPIGTKDYGILAVSVEYYTEPEMLFKVSRNSFYPKPGVDSAIVRMNFRRTPAECDKNLLTSIVRSTFGKRRKTLRNGLRYMGFADTELDSVSFDLSRRPEQLSLGEFIELTRLLHPFRNSLSKEALSLAGAGGKRER
jgi:16S rRNA (adenine1518-N6/adenine1519-N6)-dimethyltransferase